MQHKQRSLALITLPLAIVTTLCIEASINSAEAQIVPDRTLGAESSVVTPDVEINGIPSDRIDGGATRGANLFHSFQEFNVGEGQGAYFSNPAAIENILSRVTGSNLSEIFGTLGVLGDANLFFINPNGIVFGPNARLDVGGSFVGSTADSLVFENGFEFSASNPQAPPLLTVNIPIGLNFRDNPEEIVNRSFVQNNAGESVGLEVVPGKNLTFVGGNINFEAGKATAKGGVIELGGLSEAGTVGINDDGSLNFPEDVAKADINLNNAGDVDVRGAGGGSITINARNLNLEAGESGSSFIRAGITADSTSSEAQAGDITISATDNVTIDKSTIANQVASEAVGNAGGITITTGSLTLTNGGRVDASTEGQGNAGSVEITATDTITADGERLDGSVSIVVSRVRPKARGNAGDINITTDNLTLTNGGRVDASTEGQGNAGSVEITASDTITIDNVNSRGFPSGAFSQVTSRAVGNAGGVTIDTGSLTLANGGRVTAATRGQGNAALVEITASDTITFDNGVAFSRVASRRAVGNAGGVTINTGSLTLTNGGKVDASTFGQGNAGSIKITASDTITIDGDDSGGFPSQAVSQVTSSAVGDAGGVTITTGSLTLTNGGRVIAFSRGQGNAGSVEITASDTITIDGESSVRGLPSDASSAVTSSAVGDAGGVTITTGSLTLTNGGRVSTSTFGQGNAGSVEITASDTITIDGENLRFRDPSQVSSSVAPSAVGNAGGVTITTGSLTLTNGGRVDASTEGQGNAGSVEIAASDTITIDGENLLFGFPSQASSAVASGAVGNVGDVTITTGSLSLTNGGRVDASTEGQGNTDNSSQGGNITITADSLSLDQGNITAETGKGGAQSGANITLQISDLLTLSNESLVSAQAFETAGGGNIDIDTKFLIAFPPQGPNGSDIIAKASEGRGGKIEITAQGVFGIEERKAIPGNRTNDIDASSELGLSGSVEISPLLEVDPIRRSVELPEDVVDPAAIIAQNPCSLGLGSEFVIIGRGGLPPSPSQVLGIDSPRVGLVEPASNASTGGRSPKNESETSPSQNPQSTNQNSIVPARGWIYNEKGEAVLVGYDPTKSGVQRPRSTPASCPVF